MVSMDFMAVSINQELNLNLIAGHFGIQQKFKWEDTLVLRENDLKGILHDPANKTICLYHFGCFVGINVTKYDITDFYNYLCQIDGEIARNNHYLKYTEFYRLDIQTEQELEVHNNNMVAPKLLDYYVKMITLVLAKSVALDRIEDNLESLSDEIEKVIDYLEKGKLNITDAKLAKLSARILRYKYNTISYVMLLDKPDITWTNEGAEDIFIKLADLFDLQERYENIRHKAETIMDITEVFTILSHAKRGNRLEWMIIILITLELVLSLSEKFFG